MKTLGLVILCAAITSCWAVQSDSSDQKEPFIMTITPSAGQAKVGVEVRLKIQLTNTTRQDMPDRGVFIDEGIDTSYRYDCRDAAGRSVAKQLKGVGSGHEVPGFKAGESRESWVTLNRVCDLSQPGEYKIQLSRTEPVDLQHSIRVKSNKITITVTPPTAGGGSDASKSKATRERDDKILTGTRTFPGSCGPGGSVRRETLGGILFGLLINLSVWRAT